MNGIWYITGQWSWGLKCWFLSNHSKPPLPYSERLGCTPISLLRSETVPDFFACRPMKALQPVMPGQCRLEYWMHRSTKIIYIYIHQSKHEQEKTCAVTSAPPRSWLTHTSKQHGWWPHSCRSQGKKTSTQRGMNPESYIKSTATKGTPVLRVL